MEFIIWTFVFWGMQSIARFLELKYGGGVDGFNHRYPVNIRGIAELFTLIAYIVLYILFIK